MHILKEEREREREGGREREREREEVSHEGSWVPSLRKVKEEDGHMFKATLGYRVLTQHELEREREREKKNKVVLYS